MIYKEIYNFCKVRNNGTALSNGRESYPPRVIFIIDLLKKYNIDFEIDSFEFQNNILYNIYLLGTNDKWIMAHHDVCNHRIDNANDNSASVINAIALKILRPNMNIALVDGEEPPCMGAGSGHFSKKVNTKELNAEWVLNFELTGIGGTNFFVGNYNTKITNGIVEKFACEKFNTPFNDASIMIENGLNSTVINTCPIKKDNMVLVTKNAIKTPKKTYINGDILTEIDEKYLEIFNEEIEYDIENKPILIKDGEVAKINEMNTDILDRCHIAEDHIGHIVVEDMKNFIEKIVIPICDDI